MNHKVSYMKKGITAVVAIVLLLMMTVGAAGLAYVWVTGLQNKAQDTTGSNVRQMSDESGAKIVVDSVWNSTSVSDDGLSCNDGCIAFNVRNTGSYIFDKSKMSFYVSNTKFEPTVAYSGNFGPKAIMEIKTGTAYPSAGQSKTVKVTTEIGSAQATSVVTYPQKVCDANLCELQHSSCLLIWIFLLLIPSRP